MLLTASASGGALQEALPIQLTTTQRPSMLAMGEDANSGTRDLGGETPTLFPTLRARASFSQAAKGMQRSRSMSMPKPSDMVGLASKESTNVEKAAASLAAIRKDMLRSASKLLKTEDAVSADHVLRTMSKKSSNAEEYGADARRSASKITVTNDEVKPVAMHRWSSKGSLHGESKTDGRRLSSKKAPDNNAGTAPRSPSKKQPKESTLTRLSKATWKDAVDNQPGLLGHAGVRQGVRRRATIHIAGPLETDSNHWTPHEETIFDRYGTDSPPPPRPQTDIVRLSKELSIPLDIVKEAADFFRAQLPITQAKLYDPLAEGQLTHAHVKDLYGDPPGKGDETVSVDFQQFALLFYCRGFNEGLTLTEEQRNLRQLARRHNISISDLDEYKLRFDKFDVDGNKTIDEDEFEALLHQLIKVPDGHTMPPCRITQLWHEADMDRNGSIDFEEFMCFHHKYFKSKGSCPFSNFYSQARTVREAWEK